MQIVIVFSMTCVVREYQCVLSIFTGLLEIPCQIDDNHVYIMPRWFFQDDYVVIGETKTL